MFINLSAMTDRELAELQRQLTLEVHNREIRKAREEAEKREAEEAEMLEAMAEMYEAIRFGMLCCEADSLGF